jgi:hypothetical protein
MEVKDAVKLAKKYVADIFADENIREIGLEETEYLENKDLWQITVGFRRPFSPNASEESGASQFAEFLKGPKVYEERWYKVVEIDNNSGKVNNMRDRILRSAA